MFTSGPISKSATYRTCLATLWRVFDALWVLLFGVFVISHHAAAQPIPSTQQPAAQPDTSNTQSANPVITTPTIPENETVNDNAMPPDWYVPSGDSTLVIDAFDYPKSIGTYPEDIWEGRSGFFYSKTSKNKVYYKVQKEGENYYLSAEIKGDAVNFGRKARVNLRLHQKLRWRWRVHSLPEGADEREDDTNDSAAAVRIIIGTSKLSAKAIKYVWSASLPPGTVIDSGRLKVIVLESGPEKLGRWIWEEVNIYEDYRRLFGGNPRPAGGLGLLTDSNNTNSFVKADYDDIIFLIPRPDTIEMVPDFMLQNQ